MNHCVIRLCYAGSALVLVLGAAAAASDALTPAIIEANRLVRLSAYPDAEKLLREAQGVANRGGVHDYRLGAILSNLGWLCHRSGRFAEARELTAESIELYGSLNLPGREANAWALLGSIEQDAGRYLSAEKHFRRSIALVERTYGADAPGIAGPLNDLATLYLAQGRYTRARQGFERVLSLQRHHPPDTGSDVARTLVNLGRVRQALHEIEAAEQLYREALERLGDPPGRVPDLRAAALTNLATLYAETHRSAAAEEAQREALRLWKGNLGARHPAYAKGLANLAVIRYERGHPRDAAGLLREALEIAENRLGPSHPQVGRILSTYSEVLRVLKRGKEAKRAGKRARAILAQHSNENMLDATIHVSDLAFRQSSR